MLKEKSRDLYLNHNYNCSETIILAANELYGLGIDEESIKLFSAFGAGMGCDYVCGALVASMNALSKLYSNGKAHETDGFKELCADYVETFRKSLGSDNCGELKEKYRYEDDRRCVLTIEKAAEVLEAYIAKLRGETADEEAEAPISPLEIKRLKGLGFLQNRGTNKFNARVITVNGKLTAAQMRCIAEAAELYGSGEVTMTTRLTQEVIGVHYNNIDAFISYLAKAGLTTGGTGSKVRPVVACKGTTCQYGLLDSYALSEEIHHRFYEGFRALNLPHKFKIAVGGCPNNCVKPSLNDIGIIGQRIPTVNIDACKGCKKCQVEEGCPIHVAKVTDGKVVINPETCNHCGRCIGKCPFHVIDDGTYGFAVVIGGRWGKHVAQGQMLRKIFLTKEEALSIIEKTILLFAEQGISGERLSDTVARLGFDNVEAQLLSDDILGRKEQIMGAALTAKGGATC